MSNIKPGVSLISLPENREAIKRMWQLLSNFICRDKNYLSALFSHSLTKDKSLQWLSKAEDAVSHLLFLAHIMGGAPARGTEIATYKLSNTDKAIRNVYISQRMVSLLGRYNKTRSFKVCDTLIPRYLDPETSKLFLAYVVFVRPLEVILVREYFGEEACSRQSLHLFASLGMMWSDDRICQVIDTLFTVYGIPNYNVRRYRQYYSAMSRYWLQNCNPAWQASLISQEQLPIDEQMGHTANTAGMRYGRSREDHRHLTPIKTLAYRICSIKWQELLLSEYKPPVTLLQNSGPPAPGSKTSLPVNEPLVSSPLPLFTPSLPLAPSLPPPCLLDSEFVQSLHRYLENYLTTEDSRKPDGVTLFKSPQQLTAVVHALKRERDLLVVMPTGAGKSLIFELPVFIEGSKFVTIVIVPLVALAEDHVQRCRARQLSAARFSTGMEKKPALLPNLLLFSVEQVASPQYISVVHTLSSARRLARIVVDEVHCVETERDYRVDLSTLYQGVRPIGITAPLVLLTATSTTDAARLAHKFLWFFPGRNCRTHGHSAPKSFLSGEKCGEQARCLGL